MESETEQTATFAVYGMKCDACVGHVYLALTGLAGVRSAQVSLEKRCAVVIYDSARVTPTQMIEAIEEEGYEATPA